MTPFLGGLAAAFALVWMVLWPGLGLVRLAERAPWRSVRTWTAAWLAGLAVSAVVLYVSGRVAGFSGVGSLIATTVAGGVFWLAGRWVRARPPRAATVHLPRWAWAVLVLATLSLGTAYVEFAGTSDLYAIAVTDWNERQAAVWAVEHDGLPLTNSVFYPGRKIPMYYPVGGYLAVAAAGRVTGNAVSDAWPYAIMTMCVFFSLVYLAADTAGRMFGLPGAAAWAVVLVLTGGFDVVVNVALYATGHAVSLGHVGAWAPSQFLRIDGLYEGAMWAMPHLAPSAIALVLLQWMPLDVRRRPGAVVATGLVWGGMFYLSAYGGVAFGAILLVWLAVQAWKRRRRALRQAAALGLSAAVAAASLMVWVIDIRAADCSGGSPKLILGLPPPAIYPVSALVGTSLPVADLAVQWLLEVLPVAALGLAGWLAVRKRARAAPAGGVLGWAIPTVAVLTLAVQSPGWNIWALRTAHFLQTAGAVLGAGWMAAAGSRTLRRLALVGIAIGLSATVWEAATENVGRFVMVKPPERFALYQAAEFIDRHTPPDAVVAIDPTISGSSYARRWSNRRALLENSNQGSRLFCDPSDLARIEALQAAMARQGVDAGMAGRLRDAGATVALVPARSAGAGLPPESVLYRNSAFAVIDLAAASAATPVDTGSGLR